MAELTALQSVPGGQIGSGTAQTFNPMPGVQILAQARQRQAQIDWHNKQEALRRQQLEAAARKQAAEEEVAAKFDVAQGNHFRQAVQEVNDAEVARDMAEWPTLTKAQKMQRIADRDALIKSRNQFIASQDKAFADTRTRLGNDYIIPATVEKNLVIEKVKNDPNFYKKDFTTEFERTITSNPAYFNWNNVGTRITEKVKTIGNKTVNPSGTGTDVKFSQFYTGKKDPMTGLPVINKNVALDIIEADPVAENMRKTFVAQRLPELQQQFPNLKPQELLDVANSEVINRMFKGRGIYDVTTDLQSTQAKARQTAKGTELAGVSLTKEPATVDFRFTPESASGKLVDAEDSQGNPIKNSDGTIKKRVERAPQQVGRINFGNVQTFSTPKTPIPIGSNRRVLMLSDPTEALDAGLIEENPRGGYNLKISGDLKGGQIVDVHIFKKDVTSKKGGYKVKKGTPVTDEYYNKMTPERRRELTETIKAYRFTPNLMTSELDEETEQLLFKNPKVGVLDVLVPVDQAGDITTALKRQYSEPTTTSFNPFD